MASTARKRCVHVLRGVVETRGNAIIQYRLHVNRCLATFLTLRAKLKCKVRGDPGDPDDPDDPGESLITSERHRRYDR